MKTKTILLLLTVLIITTALIGGITKYTANKNASDEKIGSVVIGVPNWKSAMATAYILREIIKKDLSIKTRLQSGTNEEIYAGIANGTIHIHPEGRTPGHKRWHTHLKGKLERSKNGTTATQGLCVDRTLALQYNIKHINDLLNPGIAQYFDTNGDGKGEIWIGDERWSTTIIEQIRAKSYGYNTAYELLQMSESSALQRLEKTTAAGKLFALHCYTPHWAAITHNLYQLKEPKHDASKWKMVSPSEDPQWLEKSKAATAWRQQNLHIYYTKSLKQQHPALAQLLKKARFTLPELIQITHDIEKGNQDLTTYAQQWVAKNR